MDGNNNVNPYALIINICYDWFNFNKLRLVNGYKKKKGCTLYATFLTTMADSCYSSSSSFLVIKTTSKPRMNSSNPKSLRD